MGFLVAGEVLQQPMKKMIFERKIQGVLL